MLFFYSTQPVSTSQTSELLHFLKNRVGRSISLLYTSSYIMMPWYSLTWYFSPIIFQLFPSFDPKFQWRNLNKEIFVLFLINFWLYLRHYSVYFLSYVIDFFLVIFYHWLFFLIIYVISWLSTVINYFLVKPVI